MNSADIELAINAVSAAIMLASKLGVNLGAVSSAIEQARAAGEDGITDAQLKKMIDDRHAAYAAEEKAYKARIDS
jgi:3-hydroxyisobutyrate dehydrogenase-like beta-hydroxyacid dehydrogenase